MLDLAAKLVAAFALSCTAAAQVTQFVAAPLPALSGWSPHSGVLADFDRDGDADLLPSGSFATPYAVFRNDGLGGLTASVLPPASMTASPNAAFIDFDGDNDDDVLMSWTGSSAPNYALRRYAGGNTWLDATASLPAFPGFTGMFVADLDGDGDQDVAGAGNAIAVTGTGILTNTNGVFTFAWGFGNFTISITGGDVDGDGDVDLVTTPPVRLWRNDGGMVFTDVSAQQLPALPNYTARLAFGDVDGDGDQDLVVGSPNAGQPDRLLRNNGSGFFVEATGAIPPPPAANTSSVAFADVDEDGDLDLVRGGYPHPNLSLNDGTGTFTLALNRLPPLASVEAAAVPGDLDRDGDADLLLLGMSGHPSRILWNQHRHVSVPAPPAIGQSWTVELWGQPGYGTGTRGAALGIGLARFAQPVVVPPLGALWLDIGAPVVLLPALIAPGAGAVPLSFAIPNAPSIVGVALHAQALIEETAGTGDVRLTQLVSASIQ